MEELGVNVSISEERLGHALSGAYEIWFYEVEVDEFNNEEPIAKEHVEVDYFRLTDDNGGVGKLNMNGTNRVMMSKLINSYS